jgi:two-component system response regulator YesN
MKQAVVHTIVTLMERLTEQKRTQKRKPIREAMNYVAGHYQENITLEMVAQEINLNPVYFSSIFKKETERKMKKILNETKKGGHS